MRISEGEQLRITLQTADELQAVGWACSDIRADDFDGPESKALLEVGTKAYEVRHNGKDSDNLTFIGSEADLVVSVLKGNPDIRVAAAPLSK